MNLFNSSLFCLSILLKFPVKFARPFEESQPKNLTPTLVEEKSFRLLVPFRRENKGTLRPIRSVLIFFLRLLWRNVRVSIIIGSRHLCGSWILLVPNVSSLNGFDPNTDEWFVFRCIYCAVRWPKISPFIWSEIIFSCSDEWVCTSVRKSESYL